MALHLFVGILVAFSTEQVGVLVRGSACRKATTYTQDNTYTEEMHTEINAFSGIRTRDLSD
jgi:hypothetical protein